MLSGAADPERARRALASAERHLVREEDGVIRLLWPPLDQTARDPGYLKAYPPGIRENGGQYSHAAAWLGFAFAALGDAGRTARVFALLNPIARTAKRADAERHRGEPYVLAADIYSVEPYAGRGGWTWYTGSASWLYRIVLEYVLGVRREGDALRVEPCAPPQFHNFSVRYRHEGGELELVFERVEHEQGVSIELDGQPIRGLLPLSKDHRPHRARIRFGSRKPSLHAKPLAAEETRRFKKLG